MVNMGRGYDEKCREKLTCAAARKKHTAMAKTMTKNSFYYLLALSCLYCVPGKADPYFTDASVATGTIQIGAVSQCQINLTSIPVNGPINGGPSVYGYVVGRYSVTCPGADNVFVALKCDSGVISYSVNTADYSGCYSWLTIANVQAMSLTGGPDGGAYSVLLMITPDVRDEYKTSSDHIANMPSGFKSAEGIYGGGETNAGTIKFTIGRKSGQTTLKPGVLTYRVWAAGYYN